MSEAPAQASPVDNNYVVDETRLRTQAQKREFSDKERSSAADSGAALPDGSFPIESKEDLSNAIQAHGRAKNKAKAKAHIIRRAKALGATDSLPDEWKKSDGGNLKKYAITEMGVDDLSAFWERHKSRCQKLLKGVYDVATLAGLISQLKCLADSAAYERKVEGDSSKVPEELRDAAGNLLSVLSDMASEESGEIKSGKTAEDVLAQAEPAMSPGLYRSDVGEFAKALRSSLFAEDADMEKIGRRNNAQDQETIQKVHDAACELGADCGAVGKAVNNTTETTDMTTVNKADTISAEGDKRGAAVSDPKPGQNSMNATDDEARSDNGGVRTTKGKKRMDKDMEMAHKAKPVDDGEDDDEDESDDGDENDDYDSEDDAPPKKPMKAKKKAAKSFSNEDLAKMIATTVAATLQAMSKSGGTEVTIPRVAPNLMQVGKGGEVNKMQNVNVDELRKSVQKVNAAPAGAGDNDTATLIKAIHAAGPTFRLDPREIPSSG